MICFEFLLLVLYKKTSAEVGVAQHLEVEHGSGSIVGEKLVVSNELLGG